ncbi:MAG TPA: DUF6491 family protein [Allosphingosinicella sp.]|jgi:hypothetical protein
MRIWLAAALLSASAGCATPELAPPATGPESYIPYANRDGIGEWRVAGDDGLYIRALTGGWYLVRTMGLCTGLKSAIGLGFEASFGGKLDRYSTIIAEGQRCPIQSVTRWEGDPPRRRSPAARR